MISIGITGTGSLIGQAIIKSIRRSDLNSRVELNGMDYFENTVGSFWCEKNFLLPDLLNEEVTLDQWEQTIVEIIVKNKLRILFVGVDFELIHFSRLKNQIYSQTGCTIFVSDENVISISNDKFLTYKFLKEGEIPYPASFLKIEDISGVQFPLIIKPRIGARSRGVYKVDSFEELKKDSMS